MTNDEAQAEALKRYGPNAYIHQRDDYVIGINGPLPAGWDVKKMGPFGMLLGWGSTWEAAFELTEKRIKENELIQEYISRSK